MSTTTTKAPIFVSSEIYRRPAFSGLHPLAISRHSAVTDICRAFDWLTAENFVESPQASFEKLMRFHDRDYVENLQQADENRAASLEQTRRYGFGTMENPLFEGVFARAATTVGGSIRAAEHALYGGVAFHPAGGTHHGRRDRASGFCYFNDPVFAIYTLLEGGAHRVAYVDLDAHHGDGVEAAFAGESQVFLISIHEQNCWPHSGAVDDRAGGNARNAAVPAGFNDSEMIFLMDEAVLPLLNRFDPEAIVVTCGADGLKGDPLSQMALSNGALLDAVMSLIAQTPAAVILGGGGYNPWATVRCWAGLWRRIAGFGAPQQLPRPVSRLLESFKCDLVDDEDIQAHWLDRLDDPRNEGLVRDEIKAIAAALTAP